MTPPPIGDKVIPPRPAPTLRDHVLHVFAIGFRPFFLLGALWAVLALGLWISMLHGGPIPPTAFDAMAWHRHEMLFGFVPAIIAGFLLTAVPNWTGQKPLAGPGLAALVLLWMAGRGGVLWSEELGPWTAMLIDAGFILAIAAWGGRAILRAKNRNLPIVLLLALFAAADMADYLVFTGKPELADIGWRAGFSIVLLLIGLVGGRVVPAFTRNWLAARGETVKLPPAFGRFDGLVMLTTLAALGAWAVRPDAMVSALLLIVAGLLQALRLRRWQGWRTGAEPLMLALHLAFAWLPVGLVLLGSAIATGFMPAATALHALSAGAIGAMTLAVMTRATLGHSGRPLEANRATIAIFALVHVGALLRLLSGVWIDAGRTLLSASAFAWAGAFLLFVVAYAGMILIAPTPRAD